MRHVVTRCKARALHDAMDTASRDMWLHGALASTDTHALPPSRANTTVQYLELPKWCTRLHAVPAQAICEPQSNWHIFGQQHMRRSCHELASQKFLIGCTMWMLPSCQEISECTDQGCVSNRFLLQQIDKRIRLTLFE